jgi:hypothetical protein
VGLVVAAALRQIDAAMIRIGGGKDLVRRRAAGPPKAQKETTSFSSARAVDRLEQGLKNGAVLPVTAAAVLGTSAL